MNKMERTTSIYTERKAIQEEIAWIREERRLLHDRYFELLDRLKNLDERDIELVDPNEVIGRLIDTTNTLGQLVPKVPVQNVLEYIKDTADTSSVVSGSEEVTDSDSRISSKEKLIQQMKDDNIARRAGKTTAPRYRYQVDMVVEIFKELGRPARLQEIKEIMEQKHNIRWDNPTNAMIAISKIEPRFEKLGYGTYQLRL